MLWEHEPIGECFHSFFEFFHRETTIFEEMNKLIKNNIIHVVFCIVFLICTVGVNKRDSSAIVCRAAQMRERI